MNHRLCTGPLVCLGLLLSTANAQSLGEQARELRRDPPPQVSNKVLTNDDLAPLVSPVKFDSSDDSPKTEAAPDAGNADGKAPEKAPEADGKAAEKKKTTEADQAKAQAELAAKLETQKQQITQLERELDVLQREDKLRASNGYGDASARLRDPKRFADEQRKYQDDIATKQKDIEAAKSKLDQMTDEARKADLPDSPHD